MISLMMDSVLSLVKIKKGTWLIFERDFLLFRYYSSRTSLSLLRLQYKALIYHQLNDDK